MSRGPTPRRGDRHRWRLTSAFAPAPAVRGVVTRGPGVALVAFVVLVSATSALAAPEPTPPASIPGHPRRLQRHVLTSAP